MSLQFKEEASLFSTSQTFSSSGLSPKKGSKNTAMCPLRAVLCRLLVSAILTCSALVAQTAASVPRITEQVNENLLVTLRGTVLLLVSAETLSSGSYAFTIPASSLSAGADTITIAYSGDSTYASATGTATITVTAPTFTLRVN